MATNDELSVQLDGLQTDLDAVQQKLTDRETAHQTADAALQQTITDLQAQLAAGGVVTQANIDKIQAIRDDLNSTATS